jgi:hypothetical protein
MAARDKIEPAGAPWPTRGFSVLLVTHHDREINTIAGSETGNSTTTSHHAPLKSAELTYPKNLEHHRITY